MFKIGLKRTINDDDIYAVRNDMRSAQNTKHFAKLWEIEQRAENPSIFRVMMKMQGFNVLSASILFSICELVAKLVVHFSFTSKYFQTSITMFTLCFFFID